MTYSTYRLLRKISGEEIKQLHKEFFEANKLYEENSQAHFETLKQLKTELKIEKLINKLKKEISKLEAEVFFIAKNLEKANDEGKEMMYCCNQKLRLIHAMINVNKKKIFQVKEEIVLLRKENNEDLKIATHMETGINHIEEYLAKMELMLKLI
jgi:hypothetical protein